MPSVSVNAPKTPVTAGSNGVAAATLPNVCKMPGPPAPFVPTPLPNIGMSNNSPRGYSTTVTIEGNAVAIKGATFDSTGDVASQGTGGGIISSNVQGPTSFVGPGSMDVKIEGKNVQLLGDPMLNNCGPSGSPANAATMGGVIQAPAPPGATAASTQTTKMLEAVVSTVTFESGIKLYAVGKKGVETEVPPSDTPHWSPGKTYPAVYVREGGTGEVKKLKVMVEWTQVGCDGSAKVTGRTPDGSIVIEGTLDLSGASGCKEVSCEFKKHPSKVANFESGVELAWTVEAGGLTARAPGGSPLVLYFVDAAPKPIGWSYKTHYLQVVRWATDWAADHAGKTDVLAAIWAKFSTGHGAQVPHATGFSYWKTNHPIQDLRSLLQPDGGAMLRGWSCRAIAHLFMECLAVHGIQCLEVIPETAPGTLMFLVKNWTVDKSPVPNWAKRPELYYAGTWIESELPPLNRPVPTSLMQADKKGVATLKLKIDMKKESGVPAQGQANAPLGFQNHWIVEVDGALYDTSYGLKHASDMVAYAKTSLAGWLITVAADTEVSPGENSDAWVTREISAFALLRSNGSSN